ncbi:hypothetical protein P389DRAFT_197992 [Cystobasidium minutum MCA 4210]|uniref:uncharacterized protein n=1 Tax=Cystobasidium minutum MCA 4210 TaxID=1397322 RepID=UPI0034CDD174|eukprot:jgi/Rhomi1/197992/gm1.6206_g
MPLSNNALGLRRNLSTLSAVSSLSATSSRSARSIATVSSQSSIRSSASGAPLLAGEPLHNILRDRGSMPVGSYTHIGPPQARPPSGSPSMLSDQLSLSNTARSSSHTVGDGFWENVFRFTGSSKASSIKRNGPTVRDLGQRMPSTASLSSISADHAVNQSLVKFTGERTNNNSIVPSSRKAAVVAPAKRSAASRHGLLARLRNRRLKAPGFGSREPLTESPHYFSPIHNFQNLSPRGLIHNFRYLVRWWPNHAGLTQEEKETLAAMPGHFDLSFPSTVTTSSRQDRVSQYSA